MWRFVKDKRPRDGAKLWVWRLGWKNVQRKEAYNYRHPRYGWLWEAGLKSSQMRPTDQWWDETKPAPPETV